MATTLEKQKRQGLIECSLNEILFPVEKVEITDFACNSDYAYDIYGYLGGENNTIPVKTRLNSCSDRYELVPNSEIFPPVRKILLDKGIKFEERYLHINNARFYADYAIKDNPYKVGGNENDLVYPMLKVQHSYNGLTKYMITFGYFRLVCTNGLTVPVKEKSEFNLAITGKHTASIQESLKKLVNAIENFVSQSDKFLITFDEMTRKTLLSPEAIEKRINEVTEAAGISLVSGKVDTMEYIKNVIQKESTSLYGGVTNDFLVYNAINQYVNDNSLNIAAPEARAEKDRKALEFILKDKHYHPESVLMT